MGTSPESGSASWPNGRRRLVRGIVAFATLSAAGLGLVFLLTGTRWEGRGAEGPQVAFLALAPGGSVLDFVIAGWRYHIFVRHLRPGTPLGLSIRVELATRFAGAVTPSQSGGGPAQVFVFHRGRIAVPDSLSLLAINLVSTLVFFLAAGGLTAWILNQHLAAGSVPILIRYGFLSFLGVLTFLVLALLRPDLIVKVLERMVRSLEGSRFGWASTVAWLIMRGLGVHAEYGATLAV